jgi:predicted Zn-dependent peptidase
MLHILLPLLALLSDSVPVAPLGVESAQAGASFVVHRQPAIQLVSLRMAILTDDPSGHAGAGHLIQHLVLPSLREQAARVGGTVQSERSSDAIVYTVTGPAAELSYLAGVLRSALQPPRATQGELLMANRALAEERLAEWETAERHIRAALRVRLFPNDLSAAGTEVSAERLTLDALPGLWAELYRPERVSVVAVGDVALTELETAFRGIPARPAGRPVEEIQDTIALTPLAPAQATRAWLGVGYLADDSTIAPAALSVAAHLIREDLRKRLPTAAVDAEHWWTHHGQAVVVVLSVPDKDLAAARRALSTSVAGLQRDLPAARVTEAARTLRHEMLFYSRTSERMAEVLGSFTDRDGDPDASQRFYAELDAVDAAQVRAALVYLSAHSPVRAEIPAQVMPKS